MSRALLIFGLVISFAMVGVAQTPTVTNSSLAEFQKKRLAAERDYRENYERMGFPSPEELARQRAEDMAATIELSQQLKQDRLERDRLALDERRLDLDVARLDEERESRIQMYAENATEYPPQYGYREGFGNYGRYGYGRYGRYGNGRWNGPITPPFGGYYPRNPGRLLPYFDRRGGYYATPLGVTPQGPTIIVRPF